MTLLFPTERPITPAPRRQRRRFTPPPPPPPPPPREPDPFGVRCCVESIAAAHTEAHVAIAVQVWGALNFAGWEAAAIAAGQQPSDLPPEIEAAAKAAIARFAATPTTPEPTP